MVIPNVLDVHGLPIQVFVNEALKINGIRFDTLPSRYFTYAALTPCRFPEWSTPKWIIFVFWGLSAPHNAELLRYWINALNFWSIPVLSLQFVFSSVSFRALKLCPQSFSLACSDGVHFWEVMCTLACCSFFLLVFSVNCTKVTNDSSTMRTARLEQKI